MRVIESRACAIQELRHGDVVRANRVDHDPRLGSEADGTQRPMRQFNGPDD
jgi:hypothetical protein